MQKYLIDDILRNTNKYSALYMIIIQLLQGKPVDPHELYLALSESNSFKNVFLKELDTLFPALSITQDSDKRLHVNVSSIQELYELAQRFNARKRRKAAAICFALICREFSLPNAGNRTNDLDQRYMQKSLDQLQSLCWVYVKNKAQLSEIIRLKKLSCTALTSGTVISDKQIVSLGDKFCNSVHTASTVLLGMGPSDEKVEYIEKHHVHPDVAGMEVFCGTMMQLFIGPHQPTTLQRNIGNQNTVSILSEKMDFRPFSSNTIFEKWLTAKCPGAATIDVASIFMLEDDYHRGNGGYRYINNLLLAVRIDFDRTLAPISLDLLKPDWKNEYKKINNGLFGYKLNIKAPESFNIHVDDLVNLPLLSIPAEIEAQKTHFIPTNWWTRASGPNNEYPRLKVLSEDPIYKRDKHLALLEKVILPEELLKHLAKECIFNPDHRERALRLAYETQQMIFDRVLKISDFRAFIHDNPLAILAVKERFKSFVKKRRDLFPQEMYINKILRAYDVNYEKFVAIVPRPIMKQVEEARDLAVSKLSALGRSTFFQKIPATPNSNPEPNKGYGGYYTYIGIGAALIGIGLFAYSIYKNKEMPKQKPNLRLAK